MHSDSQFFVWISFLSPPPLKAFTIVSLSRVLTCQDNVPWLGSFLTPFSWALGVLFQSKNTCLLGHFLKIILLVFFSTPFVSFFLPWTSYLASSRLLGSIPSFSFIFSLLFLFYSLEISSRVASSLYIGFFFYHSFISKSCFDSQLLSCCLFLITSYSCFIDEVPSPVFPKGS